MNGNKLLAGILIFFITSCNGDNDKTGTIIEFHLKHARDKSVYIKAVPFGDEITAIEDSARIEASDAVIRMKIKNREERPYELQVSGTDIKIRFINDAAEISITGNIISPQEYIIEKSKANAVLKKFLDEQNQLSKEGSILAQEIAATKSSGAAPGKYDSLQRLYDTKLAYFFSRYMSFADTVSSPGVFLSIYNNVDFGKDYEGLRKFIQRALVRFPGHSQIKKLHDETIIFLRVFEEEFEPGQELPSLQLPDISNYPYHTSFSKGKYVFIDFWSTWCGPCLGYDEVKKKIHATFNPDKFQLISIALDPEKDIWKSYINQKKFTWTQLIDEKVWKGEVVNKWRIDSIPYNLLLDPKGIILRKAIPADSVLSVLSYYVK